MTLEVVKELEQNAKFEWSLKWQKTLEWCAVVQQFSNLVHKLINTCFNVDNEPVSPQCINQIYEFDVVMELAKNDHQIEIDKIPDVDDEEEYDKQMDKFVRETTQANLRKMEDNIQKAFQQYQNLSNNEEYTHYIPFNDQTIQIVKQKQNQIMQSLKFLNSRFKHVKIALPIC